MSPYTYNIALPHICMQQHSATTCCVFGRYAPSPPPPPPLSVRQRGSRVTPLPPPLFLLSPTSPVLLNYP